MPPPDPQLHAPVIARLPDPAHEIRVAALHAVRGANYWSRRPVTRLDLTVGAYDELSSAEIPGVRERLVAALPGLAEHECNLGVRGGFVERLRRGTYVPHIVEHVALELQGAIGHDVGYGRTRGGDEPGEYTVVFEHRHEAVGLRAAALALGVVQEAFAGTLADVAPALAELRALAGTPDVPPLQHAVHGAVSGGALRAETQRALARALGSGDGPIVDVAPAYLLQAGLPFHAARFAVILDVAPTGVPPRFAEHDRAERLLAVLADGVCRDGVLVAPAGAHELQGYARRRGCRVALLCAHGAPGARELGDAAWAAWAEDDGLHLVDNRAEATRRDGAVAAHPLPPHPLPPHPLPPDRGVPVTVQLAVALVRHALAARDVPVP